MTRSTRRERKETTRNRLDYGTGGDGRVGGSCRRTQLSGRLKEPRVCYGSEEPSGVWGEVEVKEDERIPASPSEWLKKE